MINVNEKIKLAPNNDLIEINVSQYDFNSRILKFNFYDGNKIFKPSEDTKIIVYGVKADGKKFAYEAQNNDGVAILPLQEQMTTTVGIVNCNIQLRLNDEILTTQPFVLNVKKVVAVENGSLSETEVPIFVQLAKKEAEEARKNAMSAMESASIATESATIAKNESDKATEVVVEVKKYADSSKANAESVLNEVEKIQEVANSINQNIEEVRTKTEQVATQATNVQRNHDEVSEWKTEIVQVRSDVQETKKQVDNVNVHVDEVKRQIDTSESNVANISENVATNKKAVETIKGDVEKLKERTSELNTQTEQTAVNINKKFDEIKTITASNVELKKNVETLKDETQNIRDNAKDVVDGVVIVNDEKGSYIAVNDSTNRELKGLKVYGKSWQDGTPTIEEPKEIHSVENAEVFVRGKNIFSNDYLVNKLPTFFEKVPNSDTLRLKQASNIEVPKDILSLCPYVGDLREYKMNLRIKSPKKQKWFFIFRNKEKTLIAQYEVETVANEFVDLKCDFSKMKEKPYYFNMVAWGGAVVLQTEFKDWEIIPRFEKDYSVKSLDGGTLTIPYKLNGVPVPKDGNYTDDSGQDWIADYVDFEKGVLVRMVNEYVAKPKNWLIRSDGKPYDSIRVPEHTSIPTPTFCVRHVLSPYGAFATPDYRGNGVVQLDWNTVFGVEQFENLKKNIGDGSFNYLIASAYKPYEEIPLSQEELNAYKQLMTQYPYTTILNDKGAFMDVKYVADTKNYIDNKFEELKKAIVFEKGSL